MPGLVVASFQLSKLKLFLPSVSKKKKKDLKDTFALDFGRI